jgi:hypothetical protein
LFSLAYSSDDVVERSETLLELCGTDGICWASVDVLGVILDVLFNVSEAEIKGGKCSLSGDA